MTTNLQNIVAYLGVKIWYDDVTDLKKKFGSLKLITVQIMTVRQNSQ